MQQLGVVRSGIDIVRRVERPVSNSRVKYLLCSFDNSAGPQVIDWSKTGKIVRRNKDLYERKRGKIEDYVSRIYESS